MTSGRIWYKEVGVGRKNVPLVALHGGPGSTHDALEPLEALAVERPVLFYDQLGCGNSEKSDDNSLWDIDRYTEELAQLRQKLKLERIHLLGHSWGATLAAHYVITKRPKGIASLTLSSPLLSAPIWGQDQARYLLKMPREVQRIVKEAEISGDFANEDYRKAAMKYYKKHLCRLDPWPECLRRSFSKLAVNIYEYMWGPSEFTITGTLKEYDCTEKLNEIRVPTLFTCGKYDEATPRSTRVFSRRVAEAELAVFAKSSHTSFLEQTNEYLKVLRSFLRRSERRSGKSSIR